MEYRITRRDDHLEHHGIKGQKWGIRRYQNEDGTLTKKGIKERRLIENHYGKTGGKGSFETYKSNRSKKGALIGAGIGFFVGTPIFGTAVGALIGNSVSKKRADRGKEFYESEIERLNNA